MREIDFKEGDFIYIQTIDNIVHFATHLIKLNTEITKEVRQNLSSFQFEPEGLIIYSDTELQQAESKLQEISIPYSVEQITINPLHIQKVQGIKYGSRSEAITHILEDVEPESEKLPRLMRENLDLKQRLAESENALLTLMFGRK